MQVLKAPPLLLPPLVLPPPVLPLRMLPPLVLPLRMLPEGLPTKVLQPRPAREMTLAMVLADPATRPKPAPPPPPLYLVRLHQVPKTPPMQLPLRRSYRPTPDILPLWMLPLWMLSLHLLKT
ncbi:unnamed protein product, partial [Ectocarpus sp. 12 AP-2014]